MNNYMNRIFFSPSILKVLYFQADKFVAKVCEPTTVTIYMQMQKYRFTGARQAHTCRYSRRRDKKNEGL